MQWEYQVLTLRSDAPVGPFDSPFGSRLGVFLGVESVVQTEYCSEIPNSVETARPLKAGSRTLYWEKAVVSRRTSGRSRRYAITLAERIPHGFEVGTALSVRGTGVGDHKEKYVVEGNERRVTRKGGKVPAKVAFKADLSLSPLLPACHPNLSLTSQGLKTWGAASSGL